MSKGFDFERKKCKDMSLWWTNGKNQDVFWRPEGSGGRATQSKRATLKYSYGDMTFLDPIGQPAIDFAIWEFKKGFTSTGRIKPGALRKLNDEVQKLGLKAFTADTNKKGNKTGSPFMKKISSFLQKLKKSGKLDILDFIDSKSTKHPPLLWEWWEKAEEDRVASGRPWSILVMERDAKDPIVAITRDLWVKIFDTGIGILESNHTEIVLFHKETPLTLMNANLFFKNYFTPKVLCDLLTIHEINANKPKKKKLKRRRSK